MFRIAGNVQGGVMAPRWFLGTWVGKRWGAEEHVVAKHSDGSIVRARSVQASGHALTMRLLTDIAGHPWAPTATVRQRDVGEQVPGLRREEPAAVPEAGSSTPIPRGMNISKELLDKYGYSANCSKC